VGCPHTHTGTEPELARLRQLSRDPTGTTDLREEFLRDVRGRFRRVRGLVRAAAGYEHDVFELSEEAAALAEDDRERDRSDVPERVYEFDSDAAKRAAFIAWLGRKVARRVLEPVSLERVRDGSHWTAEYVRQAYARGWKQARNRLRQRAVNVGSEVDPLTAPKPRRQLRRLYTRTYRNLESVADAATEPVRETLTDGLAKGQNPRKIAARLTDELETIQKTRAEVLARTEIINAHADSTLDRYERAGVDEVSVSGEFATADDDRVCPICESLAGETFATAAMRSETFVFSPSESEPDHLAGEYAVKPPVHPQCRCTILPALS